MQASALSLGEVRPLERTSTAVTPWHCYAVVFGATCILIGILWDISWHSTIGRDTFWTPAHILIYLGGTVGGMCCGWLALKTTFFGTPEERAASVRIWGLRAPLGAWVTIWGAAAMLTSAPFDDWWHNAYGLDVKIISPPHSLLAAGMHHVVVGALLVVLSVQNRLARDGQAPGSGLFTYAAGIMLAMAGILVTEYSFPNNQHTGTYYKVSCALYPVLLVAVACSSKLRWPATTMAAIYMGVILAMAWVLPLFPATPKLAPIYNPLTHMVPPAFPHLLVLPALAIDLWLRWLGRGRGGWRDWLLTVLIAVSFLGLFLGAQWNFAEFLLSPAADNWFFVGNRYWSFAAAPGDWRSQFWSRAEDPLTAAGVGAALGWALLSTRLGLWWGRWMAQVKR